MSLLTAFYTTKRRGFRCYVRKILCRIYADPSVDCWISLFLGDELRKDADYCSGQCATDTPGCETSCDGADIQAGYGCRPASADQGSKDLKTDTLGGGAGRIAADCAADSLNNECDPFRITVLGGSSCLGNRQARYGEFGKV